MSFNKKLFKDKTFMDLLEEIHTKSTDKATQIRVLIDELTPLIKTVGDATVIVPLIKDYLDVSVRNDELLVKIVTIIQREMQGDIQPAEVKDKLTSEIDSILTEYETQTKRLAEHTENNNED